jgi:hypothetical protein
MALVLPGANYRQLSGKSRTLLQARFVNVHTMVGTLNGTESWFSGAGRAYSHFGLGGSGEVRQWQDLTWRAASDLQGNPWSISWETEDMGPHFGAWSGSNVPAWTDNQVHELIDGLAWCCARFNIPPVLALNSLPTPNALSYHRLGVDPWRVDGGLRYSSSYGKVCPGDRRIDQFRTEVVPEVARRLSTPPKEDDDLTPEQNKLLERIASAVIPFYQDQKTPDGRFQVQTLVKRALAQYGVPTTVTDTTELVARVEAAVDAAGSVQTAEAWSIADVMRHEVGANPGESTGEAIKRLVGEALADAAR